MVFLSSSVWLVWCCVVLYCSPNIIRVMKSRWMRWAGHVARMGDRRGTYRVLVGDLRLRDHSQDVGVDGRVILEWIFRKWDGEAWTGLLWLRIGRGGGRL
jgi:hypothetical protein